jgi:hypothetical protein
MRIEATTLYTAGSNGEDVASHLRLFIPGHESEVTLYNENAFNLEDEIEATLDQLSFSIGGQTISFQNREDANDCASLIKQRLN